MRDGARAASLRRSARASWSRPFTSSTPRSPGSARPRCRCPIRAISSRRRSPRRALWSQRFNAWRAPVADFLMPSLGADMEYGTLLEWRVGPGDNVKRGDIVAVIDTSKAEIEVEIFQDGVIDQLLVTEGTRVPVGTALATVRAGAGDGAPPPPQASEPIAVTPALQAAEAVAPSVPPATPARAVPE